METFAGGSSELPARLAVVIDDGGRVSKCHNTDTEHAVVSSDDLLIEILLRSPAISIIRWKSVSKRWLSLITSPTFALFRNQINKQLDPPYGLFLRWQYTKSRFEYLFVPLDIRIPANKSPPKINLTSAKGYAEILQSCNGLLLCCIRTDHYKYMVYVYNPSVNLFKMLPQFENYYHLDDFGCIKMAFDPSKSPHYKVIHAVVSSGFFIQLQIYSSESDTWSVCGVRFTFEFFKGFSDGVYWNDNISWLSGQDRVTFLYRVTCLNLTVQPPLVRCVEVPEIGCDMFDGYKLFESRGCLLLVCKTNYRTWQPLTVYEMNEYDEWLLKYRVCVHDITMTMSTNDWLFLSVRSIMLGESEDESFLVMELNGKIYKYNIMLKTLCVLFDLESSCVVKLMPKPPSFDGFPFIASFAVV